MLLMSPFREEGWLHVILLFACAFSAESQKKEYKSRGNEESWRDGYNNYHPSAAVANGELGLEHRLHVRSVQKVTGSWPGKWFPHSPEGALRAFASAEDTNSQVRPALQYDSSGRVKMGEANAACDDAKAKLDVDWDGSPTDYTCYHPRFRYPSSKNLETIQPIQECEDLPAEYRPKHFCMNQTITYAEVIPTSGPHRPLWPKFGEYKYVPPQRWLHNVEHGAVVMLYHPCTEPMLVEKLRRMVTQCVGKYIITPYNRLPKSRPLALVAWGCKLQMASINDQAVKTFLRTKSLHGPEGVYAKEGQYDLGLLKWSNETGKTNYTSILCSNDRSTDG